MEVHTYSKETIPPFYSPLQFGYYNTRASRYTVDATISPERGFDHLQVLETARFQQWWIQERIKGGATKGAFGSTF
jgi:hypothetical protein